MGQPLNTSQYDTGTIEVSYLVAWLDLLILLYLGVVLFVRTYCGNSEPLKLDHQCQSSHVGSIV